MRRDRFVIVFVSLLAVLVVSVASVARLSASQSPLTDAERAAVLISAFDGCIQGRFADIDDKFGFRRIVTPGETPHRFKPESTRELDAVRGLEGAGFRVVLYLTGRRVLREDPQPDVPGANPFRALIKGPVVITHASDASASAPASKDVPAPKSVELWNESRQAMLAFAKRDSFDFAKAGWNFIARPVRASDATCLKCHRDPYSMSVPVGEASNLKVGDALGVVLYGYMRER
jgi:hypothetical protein